MYRCSNFFPRIVVVAFIKQTLDGAWRQKKATCFSCTLKHYFQATVAQTQTCAHTHTHAPRGMMERYFPLNLLANVISCLSVQPFSEKAWCAAAGGWWLTWDRVHNKTIPNYAQSKKKPKQTWNCKKKKEVVDKTQLGFCIFNCLI